MHRLDCAVIGGGLSGVVAAHTLTEQGWNVGMFEATARVGGRIDKNRGAELLHGEGPLKERLEADGFSLEHVPLDESTVRYWDGTQLVSGNLLGGLPDRSPDAVIHAMHEAIAQSPMGEALSANAALYLNRACEEQGVSQEIRLLLRGLLETEYGTRLSSLSGRGVSEGSSHTGKNYAITEGYDAFVARLAKGLRVYRNVPVHCVDYESADDIIIHTREHKHRALTAVIATPLSALKTEGKTHSGTVNFTPELPPEHRKSIEAIGMGTVCKIFCTLKRPVMPEDIEEVRTALPYARLLYPTDPADQRQLTVFLGGEAALRVERMKNRDEAIGLVERDLQKVFGAETRIESATTTNWQSGRPFTRMSYSYLPYGQDHNLRAAFEKPVDERIVWAGEYATPALTAGTTHAAYETGLRAAEQADWLMARKRGRPSSESRRRRSLNARIPDLPWPPASSSEDA